MKKIQKITKIVLALACCVIVLTGCGGEDFLGKLPDEPIVFQQETYVNPDDSEDTYAYITYKGRTYIPYSASGVPSKRQVTCIGYIYREDFPDDINTRIFTIKSDPAENYLMEFYTYGGGFMQNPMYWRALDTKGKKMSMPDWSLMTTAAIFGIRLPLIKRKGEGL